MSRELAIAILSDLHCGHIFGLMPPDFTTNDERPLGQNPGQAYLWQCFASYAEQCGAAKPVALVVNGDAIDGAQPKQRGAEACIVLPAEQARCAAEAVTWFRGKIGRPPVYVVAGTDYHDGNGSGDAQSFANMVKAVPYNGMGGGLACRESLLLDVSGVLISFAHHVSVAQTGIGLEREIQGVAQHMDPRPDVIVRSHVHHYREMALRDDGGGCITPCWQLQTKFMRRPGLSRLVPSIGGVILWVNPEAKRQGRRCYRFDPVLFDLPRHAVTLCPTRSDRKQSRPPDSPGKTSKRSARNAA